MFIANAEPDPKRRYTVVIKGTGSITAVHGIVINNSADEAIEVNITPYVGKSIALNIPSNTGIMVDDDDGEYKLEVMKKRIFSGLVNIQKNLFADKLQYDDSKSFFYIRSNDRLFISIEKQAKIDLKLYVAN